jgi:hypothetical protein
MQNEAPRPMSADVQALLDRAKAINDRFAAVVESMEARLDFKRRLLHAADLLNVSASNIS